MLKLRQKLLPPLLLLRLSKKTKIESRLQY
jgi:hypothetical protein